MALIGDPWAQSPTEEEEAAEKPECPCFGLKLYSADVREYANHKMMNPAEQRKLVSLGECIGPTIRALYCALPCTLIMPIFMLGLGWMLSSNHDCVVTYSATSTWLFFVPLCLVHVCLERFCFLYSSICFAQKLRKYRILGVDVGFSFWLLFNSGKSLSYLIGLATHSLFTATWQVTEQYCPHQKQELLLAETLKKSYFLYMFSTIRVEHLVWGVWLLLWVKLVCILVIVVPVKGDPLLGHPVSKAGQSVKGVNIFGDFVDPGRFYSYVVDATGMFTISSQTHDYREAVMKESLQNDRVGGPGHPPNFVITDIKVYLDIVMFRMFFIAICRTAVPVNLQITMLAIQYADRPIQEKQLYQAVFSIAVNFLNALPLVWMSLTFEMNYWRKIRPWLQREVPGGMAIRTGSAKFSNPNVKPEYVQKLLRRIRQRFILIRTSYVVFAILMLWAFAKQVMFFRCEHHLWNYPPPWRIGAMFTLEGCVDVGSIINPGHEVNV